MIEWRSFDVIAHLWQSTLVIGVVWLMTLALRGNRAHVRHRLWLAASVKFLVPLSWFVSLGAQLEWRTAPSIAQPAAAFVMEEILAPPVIAAVASTPTAQPTSAWSWMLASIWIVGLAGVLFWWWRQWRLVRAALNQAKPIALGSEYDVADLTVMSSAWTFEPGVVGVWRPVLLLPEGLADRLTPAQLNAVISHERCHIGRHDNLAAAVHMVVEAIFWFHPLVWWIERRMLDERERACDEAVLGAGNDPDEYVAGILTVCRFTLRAPLACVAGVSGAELRTRLESIVRMELGKRMTVTRRVAVALVAAVLLGVPIVAGEVRTPVVVAAAGRQNNPGQKASELRFEVASIKQNKSGEFFGRFGYEPGGQLVVINNAVRNLIRSAYGLQNYQILGGPDWMNSDRYDVSARAAGNASEEQLRLMLRRLLSDRFKLVARQETREIPIYALVVARPGQSLGPNLRRAAVDCIAITAAAEKRGVTPELPPPQGNRPACGTRSMPGLMMGAGVSMSDLARNLAGPADRMVVDRTGLMGAWDLDLTYVLDQPVPNIPGVPPPPVDGVPLFTALQEQLGLKLEPQRAAVDVLDIISIERPSEN